MNIVSCQLYWKDENKEKEDSNGPFLNYVKWLPQMLSREIFGQLVARRLVKSKRFIEATTETDEVFVYN